MDYDYDAIAKELQIKLRGGGKERGLLTREIAVILRAHFAPQAEPGQDAKALAQKIVIDYIDDDAYPNAEEEITALLASRPADAALRELVEALDESLSMLCAICRILNPQHKDCTYCLDTEQERKVLERMRAALASSHREEKQI